MNDTWQTLIRAALKIGAGYLLSKGIGSDSQWTEISAAVMGLIAIVWGVLHRSNGTSGPTQLHLFFWTMASGLALCTVLGCSTNAQKVTYQAVTGTDATVRTAMTGWGAYVSYAHPGTNTELKVKQAFDSYRAGELAVIDATSALASNPGATNAVQAALIMEQAAQADLLNLISQLTNSPTH